MTILYFNRMSKEQSIVEVTKILLEASRVKLAEAIVKLERNYNPYHRVFYSFGLLFKRTSIQEFKKLGPGDKLPQYIYYKNYQINISKILDNSFHFMKPLNNLAIRDGFQGAYVENEGVSFTIPGNKLSRNLHSKYMEYLTWVNKFKLSGEKIKRMIQSIINSYNVQYYNHIKLTYPSEEYPPEQFIHKLRRDLSTYYKGLGYSSSVKNKDGSIIEKSCDFYYDRNVESLPGKKKPVILKIYFVPDNLPFELYIEEPIKPEDKVEQEEEEEDKEPVKKPTYIEKLTQNCGDQPKCDDCSNSNSPVRSRSSLVSNPNSLSFEEQKELILKQWEQNQVGGLFSNILSVGLEESTTISDLLTFNNDYKSSKGESFIDFIRKNTLGDN